MIEVTVAYSPAPRQVLEWTLQCPPALRCATRCRPAAWPRPVRGWTWRPAMRGVGTAQRLGRAAARTGPGGGLSRPAGRPEGGPARTLSQAGARAAGCSRGNGRGRRRGTSPAGTSSRSRGDEPSRRRISDSRCLSSITSRSPWALVRRCARRIRNRPWRRGRGCSCRRALGDFSSRPLLVACGFGPHFLRLPGLVDAVGTGRAAPARRSTPPPTPGARRLPQIVVTPGGGACR
jgi:hypothetical protein